MHTPTNPTGRDLSDRLADYSNAQRANASHPAHVRKLGEALATIQDATEDPSTPEATRRVLNRRATRALVFLAAPLN